MKVFVPLLAGALCASCASAPPPPTLETCSARMLGYDGIDRALTERVHARLPGGGEILLLGVQHSRDPNDPQNLRLTHEFEGFHPTIAFYEGQDRGEAETAEATIEQMGESGLTRFLARHAAIEVARLEPDPRDELLYVLQRFDIEQAALFYLLRSAQQWRDREGLSTAQVDARMESFLPRVNALFATLPPPGNAFAVPHVADLDSLYRRHFTEPQDWHAAPERWFSPELQDRDTGGLFTNAINARSSEFRNVNIVRVLAQAAVRGERVFAVVGGDHVTRIEPAIECLQAADGR